jgi:hypothetical protein
MSVLIFGKFRRTQYRGGQRHYSMFHGVPDRLFRRQPGVMFLLRTASNSQAMVETLLWSSHMTTGLVLHLRYVSK